VTSLGTPPQGPLPSSKQGRGAVGALDPEGWRSPQRQHVRGQGRCGRTAGRLSGRAVAIGPTVGSHGGGGSHERGTPVAGYEGIFCPNLSEFALPSGRVVAPSHPGGNPGENLKSISHRCYLREVAFEWELTLYLPLGCLQGGVTAGHSAGMYDERRHRPVDRCRANVAHVRQSRQDSGRGFQ